MKPMTLETRVEKLTEAVAALTCAVETYIKSCDAKLPAIKSFAISDDLRHVVALIDELNDRPTGKESP